MDLSSKELSRALRNLKIIDPKEYDELMKLAGQLGELEEIDKAKTDFLAFVRLVWPAALIGRHHQEMARVIEGVVLGDKKRAIVNMAPRMPYALDTPVPTPAGWKTIGTLEVGDMVFGPDGKPVRVVGKSSVMRKPLYEVETVDGCKIVCSDDHEWHVRIGRQGYYRRTTEELYVRQVQAKKWFKSPFLLPGKPVEYPAQELPVDPYVLGVWLGDGHHEQAVITSHDDDAPQIRAQFESRGYETTDQSTRMTFGVKKLKVALRELGVLGNKHIPGRYLLGSTSQRMDLLRGLMDTDGCVHKSGQCVFSQKKRAIVESVRMLVLSLGGKCRVYSVPSFLNGTYYGEQWVVAFFMKDCCYLERKRSRSRDNRVSRSIRVRPLGVEGDVQCIEVDSKEGLFQGPDYCVITNSKSEFFSYLMPAWYLGHKPESKIIQICGTGDMAIGWSRKVRNLINTPEYQKIFPGVKLRQDSKAAGRWHTSHDGEYFAVGAEGNVTGKGGDCLVAGTLVSSPSGDVPIEDLKPGDQVYAFDHLRGTVVISRVIGVRSLFARGIHELRSSEGHSLKCTGDHRIFSPGRGYIRASELGPGDRLLFGGAGPFRATQEGCRSDLRQVLSAHGEASVRGQEGYPEGVRGFLLRSGVQHSGPRPEELHEQVPSLRLFDLQGDVVLRGGMPRGVPPSEIFQAMAKRVSGLWDRVLRQNEILFSNLCWEVAFALHERERQFAFCADGAASLLSYAFSQDERSGSGKGWSLRGVLAPGIQDEGEERHSNEYRYSSHRRESEEQQTRESDLFVPFLPSKASYGRVGSVSLVGGDGKNPVRVYDIQVEGQSNFFANGVLVHNCIIIDDPTGEQQAVTALTDPSIYRKVYDWYIAGPRQRLQPNGRICVVQSRWATNDFTGQLLKAERENEGSGADHWEVVELPAILPSGESIWPEFWSKAQLEATRLALPPHRWNAQYQQQPSAAESALLKKEYWRKWEGARPPECHFKMVTMDTAYSDKETADFTAVTTWGIFRGESPAFVKGSGFDPGGRDFDCLILLDAWKARINFPELKTAAHKHWLKWNPDVFMVETKASGTPLIHELRARGIPISEYTPVRGTKLAPNNKVVRVNAVTDILASGIVYAPELRWAEEVIEECNDFPQGEHDDYVDCVVMALSRFRQGGLIRLPTDEDWTGEPSYYRPRRFYSF